MASLTFENETPETLVEVGNTHFSVVTIFYHLIAISLGCDTQHFRGKGNEMVKDAKKYKRYYKNALQYYMVLSALGHLIATWMIWFWFC